MSVLAKLLGTSARTPAPAGVGERHGHADGEPAAPAGMSVADTEASRERAVTAAADAAAAPPGCTCGGNGLCLHCFFAAADTVEQRMMAAALEATEQALAREVTS